MISTSPSDVFSGNPRQEVGLCCHLSPQPKDFLFLLLSLLLLLLLLLLLVVVVLFGTWQVRTTFGWRFRFVFLFFVSRRFFHRVSRSTICWISFLNFGSADEIHSFIHSTLRTWPFVAHLLSLRVSNFDCYRVLLGCCCCFSVACRRFLVGSIFVGVDFFICRWSWWLRHDDDHGAAAK